MSDDIKLKVCDVEEELTGNKLTEVTIVAQFKQTTIVNVLICYSKTSMLLYPCQQECAFDGWGYTGITLSVNQGCA